jgi:type IV secretory pathway component VirB8
MVVVESGIDTFSMVGSLAIIIAIPVALPVHELVSYLVKSHD